MKLKNLAGTVKTIAFALTAAAALPGLAAENVSWSWNCESTDCIASGNEGSVTVFFKYRKIVSFSRQRREIIGGG